MTKQSLRPLLKLKPSSTPTEQFQNEVLRPILKLQNDIYVSLFQSYITKNKVELESEHDFLRDQVKSICQKNNALKNQLIGITIGMFETSELKSYSEQPNEFNKRIIQMIAERVWDNLYD